MTDGSADVSRRGFLTAAAGAGAAAAAAGSAAAQGNETAGGNETADGNATAGGNETAGGNQSAGGNETGGGNESAGGNQSEGGGGGGGEPDFGGWLDDANNFDSVEDMRGESEVTVEVGAADGLAFGPAAVHVDNGTTVVWEWTGEGGGHNVVEENEDFSSGNAVEEAGTTFEYTFDSDGIYNYYCDPHESSGMLGSVVVGTDYPSVDTGGSGGGPQQLPDAAMTLAVATTLVLSATLGLAYVFLKFGGVAPDEA